MTDIKNDIPAFLSDMIGREILQIQSTGPRRTFIRVVAGNHKTVLKALLEKDEGTGISAIAGVDLGKSIEILYHIRGRGNIVTIRTEVQKDDPRIESITDVIPGSNFHEREVSDLLGVEFTGSINSERLILPDDWPKNLFPLRKEADISSLTQNLDKNVTTKEEILEDETRLIKLTIGPQHPALIEPEKFILKVDGEIVKEVKPRIGYVHRGIEKAAEQRTYLQDIYLVERICGICNSCHATCFCQTVEEIMGVDIPARARYLRTVVLELNRIQSHMLLLGHAGLEIGFETLFHYMWRDREPIMDAMESLTGNRVMASLITIGGVRRDLKEQVAAEMKDRLVELKHRMAFYKDLFESEPTLKMRTKAVGVLSRDLALKMCVVGPVARSSGVEMDVRRDEPYAAYNEIPFNIVIRNEGDSWARFMVRLDEIFESIKIIEYALDNLPSGPYRIRVPRIAPADEAIGRVEAPRGELFYYVKGNGTAYPERVKVRTPTFSNIPSFIQIAEGGNIADVPASFVSLDPCFSCTDR